jgi:hypothetical protein
MDFHDWVGLMGRSADDPSVRDALDRSGITARIKIRRNELSARKDLSGQGTTIVFTDESILTPESGTVGRPVLSAVMVVLQDPNPDDIYTGPLPHHLTKSDSRDGLRARLGPPAESNDAYRTDAWDVDGLRLAASYSKDLNTVTQVSLSLPNSR